MLSPTYEEYKSLRNFLVMRPDGSIHFKSSVNKFGVKVINPNLKERRLSYKEFQEYYSEICMAITYSLPPTYGE